MEYKKIGDSILIHGDCLEVMPLLIEQGVKVDAVIADIPYGTTQNCWDSTIPFDKMWNCLNKLVKENNIGVDVVSGGELYGVIKEKIDPNNIHFHGNNKSEAEMDMAIDYKVKNIIVDNLDELKDFAKKYNYPIFAKPDIGVGAAGNYKINNEQELEAYLKDKPNVPYFVETYVEGRIVTFDGIANAKSEPVIVANEIFPREIYNIGKTGDDMVYFVNKVVPPEILELGKKILKALGLKNRFFHTELFIAENTIDGWFKEGDILPLEVNIRTPGGFTPDLLNYGLSTNLYQMFADVICFGESKEPFGPRYYAVYAARRNNKQYFFTEEDIKRTYGKNLCVFGDMPKVLSDIMCDRYYIAKFEEEDDATTFAKYVTRHSDMSYARGCSFSRLIGEDKRIMEEKNAEPDEGLAICDRHIDGA